MSRTRSVTRRALVTLASLAAAAPALAAVGAAGGLAAPARSVSWTSRTMGTYGQVAIVTADSAEIAPVAEIARRAFARVDSLMSNWTTTSEVARLNREAAAATVPVHPEVARVLDVSLRLWKESDGAYDITVEPLVRLWGFLGGRPHVPADADITDALKRVGAEKIRFDSARRTLHFLQDGVKIDLGGIAKGYAVDVAADSLKARGVHDALVNISGNMVAMGSPPGADHWRIGIRDPRDRVPYFARIALRDAAISTSGQYEQFVAANGRTYGHILNPRTGRPADGLISVTIVSASALTCDAWDTPLFVLGRDAARRKALERTDIAAVLVAPGTGGVDTVWVERALEGRFQLEPAAEPLFHVEYF